MAIEEQVLTLEGKKLYEEELNRLRDVERPEIISQIQEARAQGDLSENADYESAKNRQSEIESRIQYLEHLLTHAKIIENVNSDVVSLGVTVELKFLDDLTVEKYLIVGPAEADPQNGKISNACKLSQAILGHKAGDIVTVKVDVPYEVEILSISK